jgi:hypothetical protein
VREAQAQADAQVKFLLDTGRAEISALQEQVPAPLVGKNGQKNRKLYKYACIIMIIIMIMIMSLSECTLPGSGADAPVRA